MNPLDQMHQNFRTIVITQAAIVCNGLKLTPDPDTFFPIMMAIATETEMGLEPEEANWKLYCMHKEVTDVKDRVHIPHWLHAGIEAHCQATGNVPRHYPFENINPRDWFAGIDKTLDGLPPTMATTSVRLMMSLLVEAANNVPDEELELIWDSVKAKGAYLKAEADKLDAAQAKFLSDGNIGDALQALEACGLRVHVIGFDPENN